MSNNNIPENPLRELRVELALTQEQTAQIAGVTRQVVLGAEQGLYAVPPRSLVDALTTLIGGTGRPDDLLRQIIEDKYYDWVSKKRAANRKYFAGVDLSGPGILNKKQAWEHLKLKVAGTGSGYSTRMFCIRLVYQQSLIREFEKYGRGRAGIYRALTECGLGAEQLGYL